MELSELTVGRSRISTTLSLFWAACAVMIASGYFLFWIAPRPNFAGIPEARLLLLPNTVGVFPEPQDPFLFISLALVCSLVLIGIFIISVRSKSISHDTQSIFWTIVVTALGVLVVRNGFGSIGVFTTGWRSVVTVSCILATIALMCRPQTQRNQLAELGWRLLFPSVAVLILSQRVWTAGSLTYAGPISSHYEAVTSSIVRIASGSTCLADVLPQYGCYGEFIAPFLQLFGNSTILSITTIFAVLLILAIWSAMVFAAAIIKHPLIRFGCSLCIVLVAALNLVYSNIDPILQYFPLRFFFPALSLLMAMWFQKGPSTGRAFVLGLFSGCAWAWNLESGLAVAISLAAFVMLGNFTAPMWRTRAGLSSSSRHLLIYCLGAMVSTGMFLAYLFYKASVPVELSNLIVFQQTFALTGFGMIPIPAFPAYWTIYAAVLFATLFLAAAVAGRQYEKRDTDLELAAFLAILGIGLAAYYVGRSHVLVLRLIMWPGIILIFFLLDQTFAVARGWLARSAAIAAMVVSTALALAFSVSALPAVADNVRKVRSAPEPGNQAVLDDIAFIRSKTSPGEPVGIVAVNQGVLYGHTATKAAIEGPGVAELIRRIDLQQLMEFLVTRGPEKLFIGTNLDRTAEEGILGTSIPIDFERLGAFYSSEPAPGGRLIYMKRR